MSHTADGDRPRVTRSVRAAVFYGASGLLLLLIVTKQLGELLPPGIARQIGHNSESLLFAMLVCATIEVLRARRADRAVGWAVAGAVAVACVAAALVLQQADVPASVATLNEPLLAAGILALYVNLPRPIRWPWAWSGAVLAFTVVLFDTDLVLDQAESLVPLMIAPLALDVVDRSLLDPRQPDRPGRRLGWCAALVAVAVAAMVLARAVRPDLHGPIDLGIDYAQRAAEAYWGWLLVHVYLGFWLPWVHRVAPTRHRAALAG